MLKIADRDDCRLIFTSSSEVYGSQSGEPQSESTVSHHELLTERSCYSTSKKAGEELVKAATLAGTNALSVRLFNVYGPGMDPTLPGYGRVIPNFLHAALTHEPATIFGDGSQTRSFIWIDDLVDGLVRLMDYEDPIEMAVNVGKEAAISISDLLDIVEEVTGGVIHREYRLKASDDTVHRQPDCTLLRQYIDWQPRTKLREGLEKIWLEMKAEVVVAESV